jgi:hypothetical protein
MRARKTRKAPRRLNVVAASRQVRNRSLEPAHIILKRAHPDFAPRTQQPANAAVGRPVDASRVVRVEPDPADSATPALIGGQPVELLLGGGTRGGALWRWATRALAATYL